MTGPELRTHLAAIGWSARDLAAQLGAHPNTVNDWLLERRQMPEPIQHWLQALARAVTQAHARLPAPEWRTRTAA